MKSTLGFFTRLFWIGKVEGKRNVPKKGPVILAPNHQSWLDFCFLATALNRRLYFIIASRAYKHPVSRFALGRMKHIKVELNKEGKKRVYEQSKKVLADGKALVVFPEGWMTFDGKIQTAYLGVARIALATKVDIVPTVIESYHIYPRHQKWPKFRKARCRIKFLPPIKFKQIKGKTPHHIVHDILMPQIAAELGHQYPHPNITEAHKDKVASVYKD